MPTMTALAFEPVTVAFGAYTAVADMTLYVASREFLSVVGPTSCGKSTLLNLAAGLMAKQATPDQAVGALAAGMCSIGQEVCTSAFTRNRDAFMHDGAVAIEIAETVRRMLSSFDPAIAAAPIDLTATFTNLFVQA